MAIGRGALALALVALVGCSAPRAQTEKAQAEKAQPEKAPAGQTKGSRPDISPDHAARVIPPMPPVGVEVVNDKKKAVLSWEPSLYRSVTSYAVYRKIGKGKFEQLAVINEPTFVDMKVPNAPVTYSVTARTAAGLESPLSAPAVQKTSPKPAKN